MTSETTSPINAQTASTEQLWELWHQLMTACIRYLKDTPPDKQRSAMLAVIAGFLKDNGIRVDCRTSEALMQASETLKDLALPFKH